MNTDDYLDLIFSIKTEVEKKPLEQRIKELEKFDQGQLVVLDDLKKLISANDILSPIPDLSEELKDMVLTTAEHIDVTSRLYAKKEKNSKKTPSWQADNNTDAIWNDHHISEGFLKYETYDGDSKKDHYSQVAFYVINNLTPWVIKSNSYKTDLKGLDFSIGVTINTLVEEIIGIIAAGSPILNIVKEFVAADAENNKELKKGLEFSAKYKADNKTEKLYQIHPVGLYNSLLSCVATCFITNEKNLDANFIFKLISKSQLQTAEGVLLYYSYATWSDYKTQIKDNLKKHNNLIAAGLFSLYD